MTLLDLPTTKRGYLIGAIAGVITTTGVTAAGRLLVRLGLHADLTYLDDVLLGVLVALLVLALRGNHDQERNEEQMRLAAMVAVQREIAADLRVIGSASQIAAVTEIANQTADHIHATIEDLECARYAASRHDRVPAVKGRHRLTLRQVG